MKFNFKGIRFNTWLYFLGFSVLILLLLGVLLTVFIKPYYRDSQIENINTIVDTVEERLIYANPTDKDIEEVVQLFNGNNVCAIIYNNNRKKVFEKNSLGELCQLNNKINIDEEDIVVQKDASKIIDILDKDNVISLSFSSSDTGYQMLFYGKKIDSNLASYYLSLNTPLEPIESYVDFILHQYLFMTITVIIIAIIVAYILARKITKPIVQMKKEANKLAEGNYDVKFKSNSYSEINDLALTLDDATDKLSKVDELRKDLVANVSHDIKTPLTVIKSYAEMIKDISGDDKEKRNEHLDVILKETEYLSKLVNDMQEYSKMQAGYIQLNKENFDLKKCVEDVIALLNQILNEKKIKIVTELTSVIVYADQTKISQVIYNFISNAIKHSKQKNIIRVVIEDNEEKVKLSVIDEGDGISEEALPYIWDRYYKIDKGFNRTLESTGLGLAIAKAILEGHKAKYGVVSKINEGSTFYFELKKDYEEDI